MSMHCFHGWTKKTPHRRLARMGAAPIVLCAAFLLHVMLLFAPAAVHAETNPRVALTAAESERVAAHPVIVGVYAGNHFPVEAWVAGAPEGLGVDYVKLLASRAGIRLQFRPFTDWEGVTFGESGEPVPFDVLVGQPFGRNKRLDYLTPYAE